MSYSSICQTFSREADFGLQAVLTKVIDQFGAFELNAAGELVSTKKFKIICEIDDSEFREGNVVTTSSRGRKSTNTIGPSSSNVSVTITEEEDDESDEPVMVITVGESKEEVLEDLNLEESDLDTPVMEVEVEQEQQEQIVSSLPLNETSDEEESLEEEIASPVSLEKEERSHLLSSKLKNAAKKKNNKN